MSTVKIDEIVRTKRKTISLTITSDARLVIRAPLFTPEDYIQELVEKKSSWVRKKQREILIKSMEYPQHKFMAGEGFLYLGDSYKLEYDQKVEQIKISGSYLLIPKDKSDKVSDLLDEWYKSEALRVLIGRTKYYSDLTGLTYKSIKISEAKKRWGSCGESGTLNFSWRLVMAPLRVLDYVIVHELAHMEYRNHSMDYWIRVKTIMPDFEKQKKWLEENQGLLLISI